MITLKRSEVDGKQYIIQQDDYYQPEVSTRLKIFPVSRSRVSDWYILLPCDNEQELTNLFLPFLAPVIRCAKRGIVKPVIWIGKLFGYFRGENLKVEDREGEGEGAEWSDSAESRDDGGSEEDAALSFQRKKNA